MFKASDDYVSNVFGTHLTQNGFLIFVLGVCLSLDYVSVLKTRLALKFAHRYHDGSRANTLKELAVIAVDLVWAAVLAKLGAAALSVFIIPSLAATCAASIWLWLYVVSRIIIKLLRRVDFGFQWFNRKVDIEKKPLQSIGFLAGVMAAIAYWGFALTAWLLHD